MFGRKNNITSGIFQKNTQPIYNIDNYIKELIYKLRKVHNDSSNLVEKCKIRNKKQYDKNSNPIELTIKDKVLL